MIYSLRIASGNVGVTGLSPTWTSLYSVPTSGTGAGTSKIATAPTIYETGGGYYRFTMAYGTSPFDVSELVGVIDAGATMADAERYIPVSISIRDYALQRLTNNRTYNKSTKVETMKNDAAASELTFTITETAGVQTVTLAGV